MDSNPENPEGEIGLHIVNETHTRKVLGPLDTNVQREEGRVEGTIGKEDQHIADNVNLFLGSKFSQSGC